MAADDEFVTHVSDLRDTSRARPRKIYEISQFKSNTYFESLNLNALRGLNQTYAN